jgi:predicted ester cyclase
MIAGRWLASGTYKGGFPGAKAEPGTAIRFAGADFLRVENGKVAEYWLSSDQLNLMKQLGMTG